MVHGLPGTRETRAALETPHTRRRRTLRARAHESDVTCEIPPPEVSTNTCMYTVHEGATRRAELNDSDQALLLSGVEKALHHGKAVSAKLA